MRSPSPVLRLAGALALVFLSSPVFIPAYAATYTMTLQTDSRSYSGVQPIKVSGVISPAPGQSTGVVIKILNSANGLADLDEVYPGPTTGSFSDTFYPGGNALWTSGTFTVNATWGGNGAIASQIVTFVYAASTSTTTTSTTSTSSTTTTTSTTSTSTSSTTTSTTSSTTTSTSSSHGGPAVGTSSTTTTSTTPEFPVGVLATVALAALAVVAVLSRRLSARLPRT